MVIDCTYPLVELAAAHVVAKVNVQYENCIGVAHRRHRGWQLSASPNNRLGMNSQSHS